MFGNAQFVARMGIERVILRQFLGDRFGEWGMKAAIAVNLGQLVQLLPWAIIQRMLLAFKVCGFGIRLTGDRDILARCHGHRSRRNAGNPGQNQLSG